jgi:pre-mRNA-processing factor 39
MLQADIGRIRTAYDSFLAEYPLCYGYWKKYADAEARLSSSDDTTKVFERGVTAVPYSVDLWAHYVTHLQNIGSPTDAVEK